MDPFPPPTDAAGFYHLDGLPFVASMIDLWLRNTLHEHEMTLFRNRENRSPASPPADPGPRIDPNLDADIAYHLRKDPEMAEFFHAQLRRWKEEPALAAAVRRDIERLEVKAACFDAASSALIALLWELRGGPSAGPLDPGLPSFLRQR